MRSMYSAVSPNGRTPWPSHAVPERVPDVERVRAGRPRPRSRGRRCSRSARRSPATPPISPFATPKYGIVAHLRARGAASRSRERGPWTASMPSPRADLLDRDVVAADAGPRSRRGSARRRSAGTRPCPCRRMTPSSMTKPRSSQPARVLGVAGRAGPDVAGEDAGEERARRPGRRSGTCRAATSRRRRRRCGPRSTRTCPTSGSGRAARCPDQCSHSPVSLSALVRSWNGVVRIMPCWPSCLGVRAGGPGTISRVGRLRNIVLRCAS